MRYEQTLFFRRVSPDLPTKPILASPVFATSKPEESDKCSLKKKCERMFQQKEIGYISCLRMNLTGVKISNYLVKKITFLPIRLAEFLKKSPIGQQTSRIIDYHAVSKSTCMTSKAYSTSMCRNFSVCKESSAYKTKTDRVHKLPKCSLPLLKKKNLHTTTNSQ